MEDDIVEAQREALRRLVRSLTCDPSDPTTARQARTAIWAVDWRTHVAILHEQSDAAELFRRILQVILPNEQQRILVTIPDVLVANAEFNCASPVVHAKRLLDLIDVMGAEPTKACRQAGGFTVPDGMARGEKR